LFIGNVEDFPFQKAIRKFCLEVSGRNLYHFEIVTIKYSMPFRESSNLKCCLFYYLIVPKQATHTDWQDSLIFNCPKNATDSAAFDSLIQQKKESGQLQAVSIMQTLQPKKASESDVYGYFRRTKVPDSGTVTMQESNSLGIGKCSP
jgi:hypothetical protein